MSNLKIDRINSAYDRLRISGLTVNPTGEDVTLALNRLENMMAEYDGKNLGVGYNFEDSPDANSVSNVSRKFFEFIDTNLAVRLIPDFNKAVPQQLLTQASASYQAASSMVAVDRVQRVQYTNRTPIGAGNHRIYGRTNRFYQPQGQAPNESGVKTIVIGDIADFNYDFTSYLKDGEAILSYTLTADTPLVIVSSEAGDEVLDYRVSIPENNSYIGNFYQTKVVMETNLGRKTTRTELFKVLDLTRAGEPNA